MANLTPASCCWIQNSGIVLILVKMGNCMRTRTRWTLRSWQWEVWATWNPFKFGFLKLLWTTNFNVEEKQLLLYCRSCVGSEWDALVHPGSSSEPLASRGIERVKSKSVAAFLPNSKKFYVWKWDFSLKPSKQNTDLFENPCYPILIIIMFFLNRVGRCFTGYFNAFMNTVCFWSCCCVLCSEILHVLYFC